MLFYIDPGTGSMLFTILIGVLGAAVFGLRNVFVKLRFILSGGKKGKSDDSRFPIVAFSDSKRYWNMFGPICDEFEKRGQEFVYFTASPDDPALEKEYSHVRCEFIGEGNRAFARLNMLRADVLLSTTPGLDVYQWKRSPDVKWYAHITHAANDSVVLYRMFGIDYYDAILLSGEYQISQVRKLEALRDLPPKELLVVGQPYMDAMKARLEESPSAPDHQITVLLAPSWGKSAIFSRFGGKIIDALLKTGFHVIIRPHPQSFTSEKELLDGLMAAYPDSDRLEWDRESDNFESLRRSDIMISDFSGVIFDFCLVFDKPVIYADTSFDLAPYDGCWLDADDLWTFKTLPRIGRQLTEDDLDNIEAFINDCLEDTSLQANRDAVRDEAWAFRGESVKLTVDYLIEKYHELTAEEEPAHETANNSKTRDD